MIFGPDEKAYRKFLLQFLDGVRNCWLCDVEWYWLTVQKYSNWTIFIKRLLLVFADFTGLLGNIYEKAGAIA